MCREKEDSAARRLKDVVMSLLTCEKKSEQVYQNFQGNRCLIFLNRSTVFPIILNEIYKKIMIITFFFNVS